MEATNYNNDRRGGQRRTPKSSPSKDYQSRNYRDDYQPRNYRDEYYDNRGNTPERKSTEYDRYYTDEGEQDRPRYSPRRNYNDQENQQRRYSSGDNRRGRHFRGENQKINLKIFICECGLRSTFSLDSYEEGRKQHFQSQDHIERIAVFKDTNRKQNVNETPQENQKVNKEDNKSQVPKKIRQPNNKQAPENKEKSEKVENMEERSEENEVVKHFTCECGRKVNDTPSARKTHRKTKVHKDFISATSYKVDQKLLSEFENFSKNNRLFENITKQINEYYASVKPAKEEITTREFFRKKFEEFIQKKWKDASLHLFGSSLSNLFTSKSDIDFCLTFDTDLDDERILFQLNKHLRNKLNANTICLAQARVPIIKLIEPHQLMPVKFDLCVNRPLGIKNSKLIAAYVDLDERVRPLVFVIKQFAKQFEILNPSHGLTSYGLNLLIIFFLQTRKVPVLPNLQANANENDKFEDVLGYNCYFEIPKNYKSRNTQTVGQLLVEFFLYYSCFDFGKEAVSVRAARSLNFDEIDFEPTLMCIEDPFETEFNCTRLVQATWFTKITQLFKTAYGYLSQHEQLPPVENKQKKEEEASEEAPQENLKQKQNNRTPKYVKKQNTEPSSQPQNEKQENPPQNQEKQESKVEEKKQNQSQQQEKQQNQNPEKQEKQQNQKQNQEQQQEKQQEQQQRQPNKRYGRQYREQPPQEYTDYSEFNPPEIPRNSLQRVSQRSPQQNNQQRDSPRNNQDRHYDRSSPQKNSPRRDYEQEEEQPRGNYSPRGRSRGGRRGNRGYSGEQRNRYSDNNNADKRA